MPLPPAPTKRAALLTQAAYDAPARTTARPARKAEKTIEEHPLARHNPAHELPLRDPVARVASGRADGVKAAHANALAYKADVSIPPAAVHMTEDLRPTRTATKPKKVKHSGAS